jgi:hypothetical protein
MLGSTYPVLSTIFPHAFLRCTGQLCVHMGTPTMALESNTDIYKASHRAKRGLTKVVSTRLAGAHAGQCQQAPWISASIRISLPNIYKPIETESETLYPTHYCSML